MRRILAGLMMVFLVIGPVRADDHPKPAGGHAHASKYIVLDEHHHEKTFDLSKPEDRKELIHAIEAGHVHEMKLDVPPEILPKRWDTGVWSIVIFVVLFLALAKFAWKPMLEGLKKREENIRGALEQAEKTRREAMELQSQLDARMRDAGAEIARMMEEARRDAQGVKDQMLAEAKDEIQRERDRLNREIALAKDQALQEIWQQSVALATSMSTKAVRRSLTEDDHRRLLDEALAELKQAGGQFSKRLSS